MAVVIQPAVPRDMAGSPGPLSASLSPISRHPAKDDPSLLKPSSNVSGLSTLKPRRERPCDACRRRKSRCVINPGASLCVLCEFHKQACTFVQDPQPRKRKVSAEVPKHLNSKKRSVDAEKSHKAKLQQRLGARQEHAIRKSAVTSEHKILGESLGLQNHRHGRHLGLSSPFEPLLISLSTFDCRNESILSLGTLRKVTDNETFIMQSDDSHLDFADDLEALDGLNQVVSPHGPALVDLFFRVVHPCFPIIQKYVFLERYRNGDRNMSPALLAGIYLLALNWWLYDDKLCAQPKPDVKELEVIASKTLAASMKRPKLSTVQAGLLLLQRPEADSWSMTTQLVAVGQELGLHLDCTNWSIPLWERSLRKRIAWALYMQDKWSSLIHGRPSHIFSANWAVRPLADEDTGVESQVNPNLDIEVEEDESDREVGRKLFTQMIALTEIMSEVMDTFYTQSAIQEFTNAGTKSTQIILERAKPVQIKLKEWFAKLPQSVSMTVVTPKKLSPTGFLHLAYFATEITLHRRIIQSLSSDTSDQYLLYICRAAAKTRLISAMDFVNRLRPEHLQSFWYFPSKMNFTLVGTFGGLLWATAPAHEEAEFYRTRLREYRWTLNVSSQRAKFLDYAVKMLDASRNMLRNLSDKPSLSRVNSVGVPRATLAGTSASGTLSPDGEEEEVGGDVDVSMGDDTPPLTRNTSVSNMSASVFSGFSADPLEQYIATASSSRSRMQSGGGFGATASDQLESGSPNSPMED